MTSSNFAVWALSLHVEQGALFQVTTQDVAKDPKLVEDDLYQAQQELIINNSTAYPASGSSNSNWKFIGNPKAQRSQSVQTVDILPFGGRNMVEIGSQFLLALYCLPPSGFGTGATNKPVVLSSIPAGAISFQSDTITDRSGFSLISAIAHGVAGEPITIYASYIDDSGQLQTGNTVINLTAASQPGNQLELMSLEGTLVQSGASLQLPLQVTYTDSNGTPLSGKTINWLFEPSTAGINVQFSPATQTDQYGTAINIVTGSFSDQTFIDFTATSGSDSTSLPVLFNYTAAFSAGKISVVVNKGNTTGLLAGQAYPITATYADSNGRPLQGQTVYWGASNTNISFAKSSDKTDASGQISTTVTGSASASASKITLFAWANNTQIGQPDLGIVMLSFNSAWFVNGSTLFSDSNGKPISTNANSVLTAGDGPVDLASIFHIEDAGAGKFRIRTTNGLYWQSSQLLATDPLVVGDLANGSDVYSLFDIEYNDEGISPFYRLKDAHGLYVIANSADGYPATLVPYSATPSEPYSRFGLVQIDALTVQSDDAMPLSLNRPHNLTATYLGVGGQYVSGTNIYWSDDADGPLVFNPNPSIVAGNGQTTTAVTCFGTDTVITNIIARAYNGETGLTTWGDLPATFTVQQVKEVGAAYIELEAVEALPIAEGGRHMLVATYRTVEGAPLKDRTLTWTWETSPPGGSMTLESASTVTDANGVCTNVVDTKQSGDDFIGTVTVTTPNSDTGNLDTAQTGVAFTSNTVPLPGAGTMSLQLPPDVATFFTGQWYDVTLTYTAGQDASMGSPVTWAAYPDDLVVFEQYTTKIGSDGKSTNRVMANGSHDINAALMTARAFNTTTGANDAGVLTASFLAAVEPAKDMIKIESSDTPPLELNVPHTLTACYTRDSKPAPNAAVVWSGNPADQLQFSPNPSFTNPQGVATTAVTAFGTVGSQTAQVYARGYNDVTDVSAWGELPLSFSMGQEPQPGAAYISMASVDPVPLDGFSWHMIRATYRDIDGTPLAGRTVNWNVDDASTGKVRLDAAATTTDADGVTTNMVVRVDRNQNLVVTLNTSTTNLATGDTDSGQIGLEFHIDANVPDAGYMALKITGGTTLIEGQWYDITSTYTDAKGAPVSSKTVTWVGYPSARLRFDCETSKTGPDGTARNRLMALGPGAFTGAVVSTLAFNDTTGTNDSGSLQLVLKEPVQVLSGIAVARAYATTPSAVGGTLDPKNPQQMIRCSVTTGQPRQPVTLSGTGPTITMFDMNGGELPSQGDNEYMTTSDGSGNAPFQLGSYLLNISSITAKTGDANVTAQLTFGEIADEVAGSLPGSLVVTGLNKNNLAIPTDSASEPTFSISLRGSQLALGQSDAVSVILNDRLVFTGTAEQVLNPASVDVAYAVLRTGQTNILACLTRDASNSTRESNITKFTASGVARTGPLTTSRTLGAPSIDGPAGTVLAKDVVNGLTVKIPAYAGASVNDEIVLYCYLAGKDPVSNASITNVLRIVHKISEQDDPLLKQQPLTIVVPQAYLSGYGGPGTLQIDYKVTLANRTEFVQWSSITKIALSTVV